MLLPNPASHRRSPARAEASQEHDPMTGDKGRLPTMPARPTCRATATACLAFACWAGAASAEEAPQPGFTTGLWTRGNLLGDAGGVRSGLWNFGITFGLQDINEVWGNVSGGIQRGADLRRRHADEHRARHAARIRLGGRHVQCQRLEHPRPQHQHRQPAQPADRERHPRRRRPRGCGRSGISSRSWTAGST